VYSPQLIENYTLKSGEGLSVAFVVIWLIGDLTNFVGAILAHLLFTVIVLAVYYTLCDSALLFQIYYYRCTHPVHIEAASAPVTERPEENESTPLLPPRPKEEEQKVFYRRIISHIGPYFLGLCFVSIVGVIAYWGNTRHRNNHQNHEPEVRSIFEWKSQVFGWISAIFYLGSRIPQIVKNFSTKCTGLSPVLFAFAIAGNTTYVASILVASMDREHLFVNAPWLAGSGLTVFLDIIVLSQFIYYRTTELVFVPEQA